MERMEIGTRQNVIGLRDMERMEIGTRQNVIGLRDMEIGTHYM